MVRYRRRSDDEVPVQIRYNLPIEMLYTFAPVIIVAVFFFHTVASQNEMLEKVDNPDHTVQVVGSSGSGPSTTSTKTPRRGDVFDVGTPAEPRRPVAPGRRVGAVRPQSPDVIHSFWVPEFYFKLDVVPGKINTFDMTPTREGVFTGRCAELCGLYHSRMIFKVHVVSQRRVRGAPAELKNAGQTGAPKGAEEAHTIAGFGKSGDVAGVQGNGGGQLMATTTAAFDDAS